MLHINTHFFPRWIYGTRRSLTKLCVRHYIMKSVFEMYLIHCKDLVLVFGLSFCNKSELKRWSYFLFLIPIHFQNGAEILWVSIKEELRRVSGDKLFTEAQNVSGVLSKEDFIYNFNDIILKIHKRSFWALIFGAIGSVWFCRSSFIQMPWLDTLMKSWIF